MLTCVRQSAASRAEGEATRVEGIAREVTAARARLAEAEEEEAALWGAPGARRTAVAFRQGGVGD